MDMNKSSWTHTHTMGARGWRVYFANISAGVVLDKG